MADVADFDYGFTTASSPTSNRITSLPERRPTAHRSATLEDILLSWNATSPSDLLCKAFPAPTRWDGSRWGWSGHDLYPIFLAITKTLADLNPPQSSVGITHHALYIWDYDTHGQQIASHKSVSPIAPTPRGWGRSVALLDFTPASICVLEATQDGSYDGRLLTRLVERHLLGSPPHGDVAANKPFMAVTAQHGKSAVSFTFAISYFTSDEFPSLRGRTKGGLVFNKTGSSHDGRQRLTVRDVSVHVNILHGTSQFTPSTAPLAFPWTMSVIEPTRSSYTLEGMVPAHFCGLLAGSLEAAHKQLTVLTAGIASAIAVRWDVMWDSASRDRLLFDDAAFSNSKRYFWALQSLRVLSDSADVITTALKDPAYTYVLGFAALHGHPLSEPCVAIHRLSWQQQHHQYKSCQSPTQQTWLAAFADLQSQIARLKAEVLDLQNSLFSASSVSEARTAVEQGENIRVLTIVTVAYLPLALATSVFGMGSVLPTQVDVKWLFVTVVTTVALTLLVALNMRFVLRLVNGSGCRGRAGSGKVTERKETGEGIGFGGWGFRKD